MTISYLAAFLGGVISLLSPCGVMAIPTFWAVADDAKEIIKIWLVFSLGLLLVLVPLGLGIAWLSEILLLYRREIAGVLGAGLIVVGLMVVFKVNWPELRVNLKGVGGYPLFLKRLVLGITAGLGTTACVGPILGAIMTLAAVSGQVGEGLKLMLAYGLGLVLPLGVLGLVYRSFGASKLQGLLRGSVEWGKLEIERSRLVGGGLIIVVGLITLKYQGSLGRVGWFNQGGVLDFFFELQEKIYQIK